MLSVTVGLGRDGRVRSGGAEAREARLYRSDLQSTLFVASSMTIALLFNLHMQLNRVQLSTYRVEAWKPSKPLQVRPLHNSGIAILDRV